MKEFEDAEEKSMTAGEEKERQPSCTEVETDKVDKIDSVELKPKPKQMKKDGTKTQEGVPESQQISAEVSTQPLRKIVSQKDAKAAGRTSSKRTSGGRRKKTPPTTRKSDGDFVPTSG